MGKRQHVAADQINQRQQQAAQGKQPFQYSQQVRGNSSGRLARALNPAFGGKRHSKDVNGKSVTSYTFALDFTGSNINDAQIVWAKLPELFGLIATQSWGGEHPNVQVAGIGDAVSDHFPAQLSQFESDGITMDKWMDMMILEGNGGGQGTESYEMMFWLLSNQNDLDVWKRGQKGVLFVIFDELPHSRLPVSHLRELYAQTDVDPNDNQVLSEGMAQTSTIPLPSQDIPLDEIIRDLRSKYDVYAITCSQSSYYGHNTQQWQQWFGNENVIQLQDSRDIVGMIAAIIGSRAAVDIGTISTEIDRLKLGDGAAISNALAKVNTQATLQNIQTGTSRAKRL